MLIPYADLLSRRHEEKQIQPEFLIQSGIQPRRYERKSSQIIFYHKKSDNVLDDFVPLINQQTEQVYQSFHTLLKQLKTIFIIGMVGKCSQIKSIVEMLVQQKVQMPKQTQGIFMSKKFRIKKLRQIQVIFLLRIGNNLMTNEIYDNIICIMSHVYIIMDEDYISSSRVKQIREKNIEFINKIFEIEQTLIVFNQNMNVLNSNYFIEVSTINLRQQKLHKNHIQNILERNLKRNYLLIRNIQPVYFYFMLWSICNQIKKQIIMDYNQCDFKFQSHKIIPTYLQMMLKQIQNSYQQQIEQILTQGKQQYILYQCLKQYKQIYITLFRRLTFLLKQQRIKYDKKLNEYIKDQEQQIYKRNQQLNINHNSRMAQKYAESLRLSMKQKKYHTKNFQVFENQFNQFLSNYDKSSCGKSKAVVLKDFLINFIQQLYIYYQKIISNQIIKHFNSNTKSVDDIQSLITLTEGFLSTLQKQIITLQTRRNKIQKQVSLKKKSIQDVKKQLRYIKEKIERIQKYGKQDKTKQQNENQQNQEQDEQNRKKFKWWCF